MYRIRFLPLLALLGASPAFAQSTQVPETVAPGRILVEMDALLFEFDQEDDTKTTAIGAALTVLTVGLTDTWDIQVAADAFLSQKVTTSGLGDRSSGIGDIYVRTKWRFLDGGGTGVSAALLPYVKFPTGSGAVSNGSVEGGIIVPWQMNLANRLSVNANAGVDLVRNDADDGYDTNWGGSASFSLPLISSFDAYGETLLAKSSGGSRFDGRLGGGVLFHIHDLMWWDFAAYRGISRGASDWTTVVRFNFGF